MGKGARNRKRRAAAAAAREDLEPYIRAGLDLPVEVVNNRLAAQAEALRLQGILEPRINGHLLVYQGAVDSLVAAHQHIAESMDFGMHGRTRWTAVWELAGRCLALCNCMLLQIRGGFASEVVPTMRAIHEASQLLRVVAGPGEEELLVRWLDSKDIGVQEARSAVNRIEKPAVALLAQQGVALAGNQHALSQQVYDTLSAPAHNMRVGFLESVSAPLKQFTYGPHPDWQTRAIHAEFAGQQIEEMILVVGAALATRFLGPDFYEETIKPLLAEIAAIQATMPIDPPAVRSL